MSSHQAAASHSGSWDEDFYLHVVSGVSTHLVWGNQTKSAVAAQAKRVRFTCVATAYHKSGDTGFWKPPDSWLSDSYSDPKLILLSVDVISFYPRDRTPLCLSPSEITRHTRVGGDVLARRGKPFDIDKLLTFGKPLLRPIVSIQRKLLGLKNLVKAQL
jgi:hypothetical protein